MIALSRFSTSLLVACALFLACDKGGGPAGGGGGAPGGSNGKPQPPGDARLMMPLAKGNSWTYGWTVPGKSGAGLIEAEAGGALFRCLKNYQRGNQNAVKEGLCTTANIHEETYTIVRVDEDAAGGDHCFFTVTATPDVPREQLRDGRYADAAEQCWTWWTVGGEKGWNGGLTESIKRNVSAAEPLLLGGLPGDHRVQLQVKDGAWLDNSAMADALFADADYACYYTTVTSETLSVSVAAGDFEGCVETIETACRVEAGATGEVLWETRGVWAPNVGKIRERQQLLDGTVTYEMELLRFTLGEDVKLGDAGTTTTANDTATSAN